MYALCIWWSSWVLTNEPQMFIKKAPNSHGWVNPKDVEELWLGAYSYPIPHPANKPSQKDRKHVYRVLTDLSPRLTPRYRPLQFLLQGIRRLRLPSDDPSGRERAPTRAIHARAVSLTYPSHSQPASPRFRINGTSQPPTHT